MTDLIGTLTASTRAVPMRAAWRAIARGFGVALLLALAVPAAHADDFLPPQEAYRYALAADGSTVTVTYTIAKGYYLYRKRTSFVSDTPGVTFGEAKFPKGLPHQDEYFGEQEIYRGTASFVVPYTVTGARPAALNLKLKLQGCADAGLCYPPQTWAAKVALPAQKADAGGAAAGGTSTDAGAGAGGGAIAAAAPSAKDLFASRTGGDDFLPVEKAYQLSASAAGGDAVRVRFAIADGYYLYRHRMGAKSDDTRLTLAEPQLPEGLPHDDEFFGKQQIYRQQVEMTVPFTRTTGAAGAYQIKVQYQGCADAGLCYPPQTTMLTVNLPAGTATGGGPSGGAAAVAAATGAASASAADAASGATGPSLPTMLLFALLGGLVLNLMPCVLPVLSIKAVSLASASAAEAPKVRAQGYAYTAGVVLSMLALAGVLLALRGAGQQIGWGFQLQSPGFVLALCYLMLLVGLNLSGVFEIGTSLQGVGDDLTRGDGTRASFFTGVLTTLVATPCTAPFMAAAVGVALTQSAGVALATFTALGLGLALPYLLLALVPAARRFLPRPGNWMTRFKQALAFPMYGAAGWLLWLLSKQAGADALGAAIAGLVFVAVAAWCYEWTKTSSGASRLASAGVAVAALALAVAIPYGPLGRAANAASVAANGVEPAADADGWVPFAAQRVSTMVANGQPVFVVFTADWCVTCKVNEKVAIETDEMKGLFASKGVALVKADWTNQDATISAELAKHGRAGVPLYLFYRPGAAQPDVLPQILTPGTMRDLIGALPDRGARVAHAL
jgi:thiol:disulfide interchange protein